MINLKLDRSNHKYLGEIYSIVWQKKIRWRVKKSTGGGGINHNFRNNHLTKITSLANNQLTLDGVTTGF